MAISKETKRELEKIPYVLSGFAYAAEDLSQKCRELEAKLKKHIQELEVED